MTEQFANNPVTTSLSAIPAGNSGDVISITLASAAGFSTVGNFRISIDGAPIEIGLVTAVVGNVLTVTRGQEGTAAASHPVGCTVAQTLTAAGLRQLITDLLTALVVPTFVTITSGQTVTLISTDDADLDTSGGSLATGKLPATPTPGQKHSLKWIAGTIPPVVDGNGQQVEQWPALGAYAATTVINQLNQGGTVQYTGARWEWR